MDDAGAVSVGQRGRDLDADVDGCRGVERSASSEVAERPAVHELIGDEVRARRVADVVNRDDVRGISADAALASRMNRARLSWLSANAAGRTFSATRRPRRTS